MARTGPLALAVGGYAEGSRGPDLSNFVRTSDYAEANRDFRAYLLDNGNPYRDDNHNLKINADLGYAPNARVDIKAGARYLRGETGGGIEAPQLSFTNGDIITEQTHVYASDEYRFASVPIKSVRSYHFILDNFWARHHPQAALGHRAEHPGARTRSVAACGKRDLPWAPLA